MNMLIVQSFSGDRALLQAVANELQDIDKLQVVSSAQEAAEFLATMPPSGPTVIADGEDKDSAVDLLLYLAAMQRSRTFILVDDLQSERAARLRRKGGARVIPRPTNLASLRLMLRIAQGPRRGAA
ncbi:MAG: hypothetical protein R3A48_29270 [Polyangiales bacterium]